MKRLLAITPLLLCLSARADWFGTDATTTNAMHGETNYIILVKGSAQGSTVWKISPSNLVAVQNTVLLPRTNLALTRFGADIDGGGNKLTNAVLMGSETWVNVRDYGATGDPLGDDTLAISNAVIAATGGLDSQQATVGTVYFPPGVYRIAGSAIGTNGESGQILIPFKGTGTSITNWSGLRFVGPEPAPYTGGSSSSGRHPTNGAVILTTLTNASASVFTSHKLTNAGWNNTIVGVENLTFQVPGDFRGTVLQFSNMVCTRIIGVSLHQTNAGSNLTYPDGSTGIDFPHAALGGEQYMERVQVEGFAAGVQLSEHHYVNQLMATFCKTGIVHKAGNHANVLDKVYTTGCNRSIAVKGQSVFSYTTINIERLSAAPWTNINDVADGANQGRGLINWRVFDNADATKHHNLNVIQAECQNIRFCEVQWDPLTYLSIDQSSTVADRGLKMIYIDNSARHGMISVVKGRGTTYTPAAATTADQSMFGAGFYDATATPVRQYPVRWGGEMRTTAGTGLTASDFILYTGTNYTLSAERLRVRSDGNVGIGTNAPTAKLHVHDTSTNAVHIQASGANIPADVGTILHWIPIVFNGTNGFIPFYR